MRFVRSVDGRTLQRVRAKGNEGGKLAEDVGGEDDLGEVVEPHERLQLGSLAQVHVPRPVDDHEDVGDHEGDGHVPPAHQRPLLDARVHREVLACEFQTTSLDCFNIYSPN